MDVQINQARANDFSAGVEAFDTGGGLWGGVGTDGGNSSINNENVGGAVTPIGGIDDATAENEQRVRCCHAWRIRWRIDNARAAVKIGFIGSGCSLMVKFQPSKLATWVRFPSPAPLPKRTCPCCFARRTRLCGDCAGAATNVEAGLTKMSSRARFAGNFGREVDPELKRQTRSRLT